MATANPSPDPITAPDAMSAQTASDVLAQLRQMIEGGGMGPGGRLPTERNLSGRLGVGRRVLRTALDALEAEGLIWRKQGKGTFVAQPPLTERPPSTLRTAAPQSVMEARLCVEPELAALCAQRATEADILRLRMLAKRTADTIDAEGAELWDGSLHRFIARVAGNPILLKTFALIDEARSSPSWHDVRERARSPELKQRYLRQHTLIVDAIAAREPSVAHAAMRAHLTTLLGRLGERHGDAP
ncbi:MAG: FCD domain-containing protein [Pseudomonadota bacterium]